MKAYKLLRIRKDGSLSPLFINKRSTIKIGAMNKAEAYPTKGYALRPGWHCTRLPYAPHLKTNPKHENRVWCEVEIYEYTQQRRPESQGGIWYLSKWMQIVRVLSSEEIEQIIRNSQ